MAVEISPRVRAFVAQRADRRCEYCLLHEEDSFTPHQIDHVISKKHGGNSSEEHLAFACVRCNAWKGPDIAGFGLEHGKLAPLFNPRLDRWDDHFRLEDGAIIPLTNRGAATERLLRLNKHGRVAERLALMRSARYPR